MSGPLGRCSNLDMWVPGNGKSDMISFDHGSQERTVCVNSGRGIPTVVSGRPLCGELAVRYLSVATDAGSAFPIPVVYTSGGFNKWCY